MSKTKGQAIGSGYHRPVCKKCNCEMRPETNGVGILDTVESKPYALWDADLWKCPKCGIEVVGGFGSGPVSAHYENGFDVAIKGYEQRGLLIINNC